MAERKQVYHEDLGVRRTLITDSDKPDRVIVDTKVDCTQLIENNKMLGELHSTNSVNKMVARVPMTIYERSINEGWDDDDWKRWLNDPDNKMFRVWQGRV
jgi:hypothetical protein